MNNKALNIFSFLVLAVIIGIMSWHDMHPSARQEPKSPTFYSYYAGNSISASMVPDDNLPVIIDLGEFKYAPDGGMRWEPHGMPPTTFAQREVDFLLHFDGVPQNPAETFKKIRLLLADWEHQGSTPTVIFLHDDSVKPDFKAFGAFIKAFYEAFGKSATLAVVLDASSLKNLQKIELARFQEYAPQFLIILTPADLSAELPSGLEKFRNNFILLLPAGTVPANIDMFRFNKLKFLSGYSFMLDAHKPWPKHEEKIGLFPKL